MTDNELREAVALVDGINASGDEFHFTQKESEALDVLLNVARRYLAGEFIEKSELMREEKAAARRAQILGGNDGR